MKKYSWDAKDIKRKYNLQKRIVNAACLRPKKEYMREKNKLRALSELYADIGLKSIITNGEPSNFSPLFTIEDAKKAFRKYNTDYQKDFITIAYDKTLECDLNCYDSKTPKKFFPTEISLDFAGKVFTDLDGSKDDFKILKNNTNNNFRISPFHKSYFIPAVNDFYISVTERRNIKSFQSLVHELGHYYQFYLDKNEYRNKPDNYINYSEITSLLFEHLGIDKLTRYGIITENEKKGLFENSFLVNSDKVINYLEMLDIVSSDNIDLKDKLFIMNNKQTIFDTVYFFSYVIAINFYEQFIKDKKQALNNLKKLLLLYSKEDEIDLLEKCEIDLEGNVLKKHLDNLKRSN